MDITEDRTIIYGEAVYWLGMMVWQLARAEDYEEVTDERLDEELRRWYVADADGDDELANDAIDAVYREMLRDRNEAAVAMLGRMKAIGRKRGLVR